MSSDRPYSSWAPQESSSREGESSSSVSTDPPIITKSYYVPHLFDLVTPTHRASDLTKQYIPKAYLESEAVDASSLIGNGASFTATRQALPPGDKYIETDLNMEGWSITKRELAPKRPEYVVYKSARVTLQENGKPVTAQDRRAMISVLTEFHALLHPPLLNHPNIIDFLGLAWGKSPSQPLHKLPVLVVEYADQGTLADLQARHKQLSENIKLGLCLGVARGLSVLHENNIVHGDIKPENVLICSHPQDKYVAKLADFGFAIIEDVEAPEISIGGTRTWRSPESSRPIRKDLLRKTDIYSFGLLAWCLAIDGRNPFDLMVSDDLKEEERLVAIDKFKEDDEVIEAAKFENWILPWQMFGVNSLVPPSFREKFGNAIAVLASPTRFQKALERAATENPDTGAQIYAMVQRLSGMMVQLWQPKVFYKDLETILMNSLSKDPSKRTLDPVISVLEQEVADAERALANLQIQPNDIVSSNENNGERIIKNNSDKPITAEMISQISSPADTPRALSNSVGETNSPDQIKTVQRPTTVDWGALGFKKLLISWQQTRDLDPPIQRFVAKTFTYSEEWDTPAMFITGSFYINGYGFEQDFEKGVQSILRAARSGHKMSQAYLYRIFTACNTPLPTDVPFLDYLDGHSRNGSRMAMRDLRILDPEKAEFNRKVLKYAFAGTGAQWYHPNQMLHGFTQPMIQHLESVLDSLGTDELIRNLRVNRTGDYLIHWVAACCNNQEALLIKLIEEKNVDVNIQNLNGETPLLCACRSGHINSVKTLLNCGAKASIASHTGETPLHWLISFDDNVDIPTIGNDLIDRGGAVVDATTHVDVSYANFPSGSDLERQIKGTPLMWAMRFDHPRVVEFLLSVGAEPRWRYQDDQGQDCLEQAAYLHNAECLEMMINHLEEKYDTYAPTLEKPINNKGYVFQYGPLVRCALHAADKFSMILRNGTQHLERLHATLKYLKDKTVLIKFHVAFRGESIIMLAAMEAHEEALEWVLENKWCLEDINKPGGDPGRTPVLESVRWNRRPMFQLLVKYGADIHALALNPYNEKRKDWSALHVFAHEAHNENLTLLEDLIEAGIPVDGPQDNDVETPFNIAVRRHAFNLADRLLEFGADLNATTTHSSLVTSPFPLTGLGHIISLNARYSNTSLQYLLSNYQDAINFIVEPERNLSALHLAAILPEGFSTSTGERVNRFNFDWETNRSITHELLEWFNEPVQINMKSGMQGKTALHLAVERGNVGVVEELVKAGVDRGLKSDEGETAGAILKKIWMGSKIGVEMGKLLVG